MATAFFTSFNFLVLRVLGLGLSDFGFKSL